MPYCTCSKQERAPLHWMGSCLCKQRICKQARNGEHTECPSAHTRLKAQSAHPSNAEPSRDGTRDNRPIIRLGKIGAHNPWVNLKRPLPSGATASTVCLSAHKCSALSSPVCVQATQQNQRTTTRTTMLHLTRNPNRASSHILASHCKKQACLRHTFLLLLQARCACALSNQPMLG